ncbi:S-adenosylmethionine:tRNA ribosyltransferase-isomerase [Sulfuritortus calidifontis]|uniref:S-adenosylmethionine:tRNA ribosyltransferase-isomerase n=1 Tax=Sulfuritortus calidifontis TaxID=1914471 RepID=A0A4R3JXZ2_9PROT|nr:tRNA preQ1(34) S-adenosylmethionine ribosyltransferase-isomerase QueA [Sulfuritortus calidifontis]TCS73422.1 S-adenosylmethionine:tRNA ribosyltransferase-isomerase [Sulfuritortus calidifontis]
MKTADFDYALPEELIARYPLAERTASRLLHVDGPNKRFSDRRFAELAEFFRAGDLLVFNDTRVIKARLFGEKASGGRIEALIERVLSEHEAIAFIRASKSPKPGMRLRFADSFEAEVIERSDDLYRLRFDPAKTVLDWLEAYGELPLPPYLERRPEAADEARYQTVYAREPGAVAAPTAGLHFDEAMLDALKAKGVATARVTLHVGAGTFQPVRVDDIHEHKMHSERYEVPNETVAAVELAKAHGGRVTAVGTTSLRALESAAHSGSLRAGQGETDLFITPGYEFRVVERLITNFHLPRSTLLMLVCAFGGMDLMLAAYRHAVEQRYRFFSYGDAMLIERIANQDAI